MLRLEKPAKKRRLTGVERCEQYLDTDSAIMYNCGVLMGNWYDERIARIYDSKAIAPCIQKTPCFPWKSMYNQSYGPSKLTPKQITNNYLKWKQDGHHIGVLDHLSVIQINEGDQYFSNLTSSYDFYFNLKRQMALSRKPQKRRIYYEDDPLKSYGNHTQYGLKEWLKCEADKMDCRAMHTTTYKDTFVAPKDQTKDKIQY